MKNKGYSICENKGVKFVRFDHIGDSGFPHHGFSTRVGGISPAPYDSLNLGFTTEDDEENLVENRRRFLTAMGVEDNEIRCLIRLVHGNRVIHDGELFSNGEPVTADGIITQKEGLPLVTTFADCVPIIMADPVKRVAGVIHAGWRGSLASIASKAVDRMVEIYGCKPVDILAGIGPGISRDKFEVGRDVKSSFLSKYDLWKDLLTNTSNNEKWKLDLLELNRRILIDRGLSADRIVVVDLCTYRRDDLFFSYRRDGKHSGRMAGVIVI